MAAGQLALVVGFDLRRSDDPEVRRLDKGPGQIAVAVVAVALTLALGVADAFGFHATGKGGIVSGVGEASNLAGFEQNSNS